METVNRIDSFDAFKPEGVVIDAGLFPTSPRILEMIDRCERTVCCDGAANSYIRGGRIPWRIVGDCDSISDDLWHKLANIIRRNPNQETNDQTKAIQYLAAKGFRRIAIVGATGLREDHSLGNISLLITYLSEPGVEARIYSDSGVFIPCDGPSEFQCTPGTRVSIFNFGATGIKGDGLQYPLRDFDALWQGTLNRATGDRFSIAARGKYLVYLTWEG